MHAMLKKFALVGSILLLAVTAYDFMERQFRVQNVTDTTPSSISAEPISSDDYNFLKNLLDQPFKYLDRGRQSYVFESQDGQYVLKFFDLKRYQPGWLTLFSASSERRMERKKTRLFKGYQIAYEHDRDHAVIVFQQLVPNPTLNLNALLIDRFGFNHDVDLATVPFIIQEKGVATRQVISELLSQDDLEGAKWHLRRLLDMYYDEYTRGLYDRDHNFMYNTGFIGDKPIRLDVGRLRADDLYRDPDIAKKDLEKIIDERAGGWLQRHFPKYRVEIVSDLRSKLSELYP